MYIYNYKTIGYRISNNLKQLNKEIMSNDNKTIHDFQFELICDYFSRIDRQGPGSLEVTKKALSFITGLSEESRIADIGCGTGKQTIYLAQSVEGNITASDLFPGFIDLLQNNIKKLGLQNRIRAIVADMNELPFSDEQFDLIWSEGAIYNIGFENGIKQWKKYLKPGGYIAVSEASWLTTCRPKEIEDYWMASYPEIDVISAKIAQMEQAGYKCIASFIEPEECWTKEYFALQSEIEEAFLSDHSNNQAAFDFVASEQNERLLYEKYKDYYGYVFYIGKKL